MDAVHGFSQSLQPMSAKRQLHEPMLNAQPMFGRDGRSKSTLNRFGLPIALMYASMLLTPLTTATSKAYAQSPGGGKKPLSTQTIQHPDTITAEQTELRDLLESEDEELVIAAIINLSMAQDREALTRIFQILDEGRASEDALKASLRALSRYTTENMPLESAQMSDATLPYMLKVVVEDTENNVRFMTPAQARAEQQKHPEYTIKDLRGEAARTLGILANPQTMGQLFRTALNPTVGKETRLLALDALRGGPAHGARDSAILNQLKQTDAEHQPELAAAMASVLIHHNVDGSLPVIEELLRPNKPGTKLKDAYGVETSADPNGLYPFQRTLLKSLIHAKQPATAPLVNKLLSTYPAFFVSTQNYFEVKDYYQAMPLETQLGLFDLVNAASADGLAKAEPTETATQTAAEATDEAENAEETDSAEKERKQTVAQLNNLRILSMALVASLQIDEAATRFPEIYTDPTRTPQVRRIAMVGSALLKDKEAVNALMDVAIDDTEDPSMRYDALSAVFELLTPPLAPGLTTNTTKILTLQRYLSIYSQHQELTQSVYLSELFEQVRDVQKQLKRNNASPSVIEDATDLVIEEKLQQLASTGRNWKALLGTPEFTGFQQEMVNYVSEAENVNGFLRTLMITALGEMENDAANETLAELIRDPLVRTQIEDIVGCNDLTNFPGYTKSKIAEATRLAAIQALGNSGTLEHSDLIAKGLRSDHRRTHLYAINALTELGIRTQNSTDPDVQQIRAQLAERLIRRMPTVDLKGSDRLNNMFRKLYAQAADELGAGEQLLSMIDTLDDPVLKRTIAHGLITNGHYIDTPQVSQYLVVNAMGVAELHRQGIDGRGTEIAIIDGDYINDDVEGLEGKVVYPDWGKTGDAVYRKSFHGESVASAVAGRVGNTVYGIAPGVEKIYSYASFEDITNAEPGTPLEETDGMIRAVDDIIQKKMSGESKVSIVNISMGSTSALLYGSETTVKNYLEKLAAHFEAGSKLGITFVISAGNERGDELRHYLMGTLNALGFNQENGNLAHTNGVILVGATDHQGSRDFNRHVMSWFSSMGDAFNESEPHHVSNGTHVPLASRDRDGVYGMDEKDGTSFSAPISSAAMLLMEQVENNTLDTDALKHIIEESTAKLPDTPDFMQGNGELDIPGAIAWLLEHGDRL